jgi:hypothetical protein
MPELHRQAAGNHGNLESVFLQLTREQERDHMTPRAIS